jgi:hypothetical protein
VSAASIFCKNVYHWYLWVTATTEWLFGGRGVVPAETCFLAAVMPSVGSIVGDLSLCLNRHLARVAPQHTIDQVAHHEQDSEPRKNVSQCHKKNVVFHGASPVLNIKIQVRSHGTSLSVLPRRCTSRLRLRACREISHKVPTRSRWNPCKADNWHNCCRLWVTHGRMKGLSAVHQIKVTVTLSLCGLELSKLLL